MAESTDMLTILLNSNIIKVASSNELDAHERIFFATQYLGE